MQRPKTFFDDIKINFLVTRTFIEFKKKKCIFQFVNN